MATAALSWDSTGKVSIGNTNTTYNFDVTGTGRFTSSLTTGGTAFINSALNNTVITTSDATNISNGFNLLGSSSYWGIRTDTSGNFNLDVFGAGTTKNALTIVQSSGNVGIGTSATLYKTHIVNAGANAFIGLSNQGVSDGHRQLIMGFGGNGSETFATIKGTRYNTADDVNIAILGGQVLVGSTASLYGGVKLSVKQTAANNAAEIWSNSASDSGRPALTLIKNDNVTSSSQVFQRFAIDNGNAANGQINGNGTSQVAFGSWSDERLKMNITDLPSQLGNILSLRPCEFDYKNGSGHQIGFIAQEMRKVYPDTVAENPDGYLTITGWNKTEARIVKAIHELSAQIEYLKAQLN